MFLDIRFLRGELFLFAIQFRQRTTELPKITSPTQWIIQPRKGKNYWVFIFKPKKFNHLKKISASSVSKEPFTSNEYIFIIEFRLIPSRSVTGL